MQGIAHPLPANLQIARTPKPMRIHQTAFASLHHIRAHRHQVQCRHSQDETQPLKRLGRTYQRRLQLKSIGLIVQKVLFDIEPQSVFLQGFHLGGFITDDRPIFVRAQWPSDRQMHRTKVFAREPHAMPKPRVARGQPDTASLKRSAARTVHPKVRLDTNAKVPAQSREMRIVKIFELAFPLEVTPLPLPHSVLSSSPLSSILTLNIDRSLRGRGDGLETPAGVYHGDRRSGTAAA